MLGLLKSLILSDAKTKSKKQVDLDDLIDQLCVFVSQDTPHTYIYQI